jgi:predicted RNA-binding protein Jag
MKSVIQEASSLAKAIEQGWVKAGKPKDFTVKIFEEPQKNFFGFTIKQAKIGIFIAEKEQKPQKQRGHVPQQRRRHHRQDWYRNNQEAHNQKEQRPTPRELRKEQSEHERHDEHVAPLEHVHDK